MIRLNLTATPQWLDLAPGLRLLVSPLTTALMVSARADPAIEALPEGDTIGSFRDRFVSGMLARGYDADFAARCFAQIEGFGS